MHGQGTKYDKDGNVTFTGDAEKREKCYDKINHNLKGVGMVFDSQMCESIRQRMLSLNSKLLHSPGADKSTEGERSRANALGIERLLEQCSFKLPWL